MGFLPWEIRVALPRESQLRRSRATQPTVHAGFFFFFSVSIIHRTLIWTTGSLTRPQMLMHAIAHGGVRTHVRESALKVDSGRKILRRTGESNLRQRRDGPMFSLTELHPHHLPTVLAAHARARVCVCLLLFVCFFVWLVGWFLFLLFP